MPQYAQQPTKSSCGPIAILNALKWAGAPATLRLDYRRLMRLTKCGQQGMYGTNFSRFSRALRSEARKRFHVFWDAAPTLANIETHLACGGAVLLAFGTRRRTYHYTLIVKASDSGKRFTYINDNKKTVVRYGRAALRKDLRRGRPTYPRIWLLTKLS